MLHYRTDLTEKQWQSSEMDSQAKAMTTTNMSPTHHQRPPFSGTHRVSPAEPPVEFSEVEDG
jgi:hypothetical protein